MVNHFLSFGTATVDSPGDSGWEGTAKPVLYWGCSQNPVANEMRAL